MGRPRRSLEDFLSDRTGQRIHDDNVTSEILTFRQALVGGPALPVCSRSQWGLPYTYRCVHLPTPSPVD